MVMGKNEMPDDEIERWSWIRNPLPPSSEDRDIEILRRSLKIKDEEVVVPGDAWQKMSEPDRDRIKRLSKSFMLNHNPFIRHIIRRTREFLKNTIDPRRLTSLISNL